MENFYHLAILCIMFGFYSVSTLRCYGCTQPLGLQMACERDLSVVATPECPRDTVCVRYVLGKPATEIQHRGCYSRNHCDNLKAEFKDNTAVDVKDCVTCDTDLCNSAKTMGIFAMVPCLILSILKLVNYNDLI